ncbi:hypothetical protein LJY25_08260 [Hymenobacter sp. BT175]|uniref:hypothetical protein n=1 Tax=Hymenobacter translucens TaxID=2886507 RepID=UPI001D0F1DD8|nr:hypothetical protein [Hymenobacter translucens]MCC2546435.1 hypothetical protein [Hymenobacter translucens]
MSVFSIPTRKHVKQYLLQEFGPAEPLAIHQNTFLGRLIGSKVEKKQPYRQLNKEAKPALDGLLISLPTALKHHTLPLPAAVQLAEVLNKFFQQQMIQFVKGQVAVTQNERGALRSFYALYDINPSDYDLEEARKVYRDYKDRVMKSNGHFDFIYGDDVVASS